MRRWIQVIGIVVVGTVACLAQVPATLVDGITAKDVEVWFPNAPSANVEKYTPYILDALRTAKWDNDPDLIAYVFATIAAEHADFSPTSEKVNTKGPYANTLDLSRPFGRYDENIATALKLGNSIYGGIDSERLYAMHGDTFVDYENGELYRGRGFIQLTGRYNYKTYGEMIGIGDALEQHPDMAEDPRYASLLLVGFLKAREQSIKQCLDEDNLQCARKLVNSAALGLERFEDVYRQVISPFRPAMPPTGLSATVN
jgi:predicted chitinase